MPRLDVGQGQSCEPERFAQWGMAERPAQSLPGITYGGRRVRREFGLVRLPYFALWLPSWQFEYDPVWGGYRWLRALLLWRRGFGVAVFYCRHPRERSRFAVTDRDLVNRPS